MKPSAFVAEKGGGGVVLVKVFHNRVNGLFNVRNSRESDHKLNHDIICLLRYQSSR